MTSGIVSVPSRSPKEADSFEQARRDLLAARDRFAHRLEALERGAPVMDRLRRLVGDCPGLALGGAFLLGYGLARLLRRQ